MWNEADLVGQRRTARGPVRGELGLVELDQVLSLASRAVEAVVEPFCRAEAQAGDDEADVEAERSRVQDFALWRSAVASIFADRGLDPARPKTKSTPLA